FLIKKKPRAPFFWLKWGNFPRNTIHHPGQNEVLRVDFPGDFLSCSDGLSCGGPAGTGRFARKYRLWRAGKIPLPEPVNPASKQAHPKDCRKQSGAWEP
ncbi:MAG: hypothetical protein OEW39_11130, partial [Deltaproteobacteria bacterium]|nr:hypothetical protein [Deltaproteobacteria bacterium]